MSLREGGALEYLIVTSVALGASALTLISGFGLGTLLLPAFALFFPVEVAVAATAVVHLANNLFKLGLVGKFAKRDVVVRFGLPAAGAAIIGAGLLGWLAVEAGEFALTINEDRYSVTIVKLVVGLLITAFAIRDLTRAANAPGFFAGRFTLGGMISGFFGGLSGHQGALRSAVLITSGLSKKEFIGTGTACAVLVDIARLAVYGATGAALSLAIFDGELGRLVAAAMGAAFVGAYIGRRLMDKIRLETLHKVVGILLILTGVGLASGFI